MAVRGRAPESKGGGTAAHRLSSPPWGRLPDAIRGHGRDLSAGVVVRKTVARLDRRLNPRTFSDDVVDLSGHVTNPIEAVYLVPGRVPVVEVPLSTVRTSLGLRGDDVGSPFVQTVVEYLSGDAVEYATSALRRHFVAWQPANAAEVVGLRSVDATSPLRAPPASATVPWSHRAADVEAGSRVAGREGWTRSDAAQYGRTFGVDDGHPQFGPVSEAFGAHEFDRYRHVAESVRQDGFLPDKGEYLRVMIMASGASWVVRISAGHHRAAVAMALRVDPLKVAIKPSQSVVHREDAASWPGVRSGLFTLEEALTVFDRIFAGEPPYEAAT